MTATAGPHAGPPPATEQVLWQGTPSLKTLAVDGIRSGLVVAATIVGAVYAYHPLLVACASFSDRSSEFVTAYAPGFRLAATLFVVTVVATRLGRLGWRALALRHHAYRVSNQRLTVETGVLSKTLQEIDMRTIEDIGLRQSLVERLLGIGRIDVVSVSNPAMPSAPFSPGSSARARLSMQGIANPRAVREVVRGAAYQATRGQLFTRTT
jgi:uncharacterized membrane protein YdbT with pleckstrin-like domain